MQQWQQTHPELFHKSIRNLRGHDNYVEAKDTREVIDIPELNAENRTTVSKVDQLHTDIDAIINEIKT